MAIDVILTGIYGMKQYMGCSLEDQDLGDIRILNFPKFGGFDHENRVIKDKSPYLIHARALSWVEKDKFPVVFYMVVNGKTKNILEQLVRYHKLRNSIGKEIVYLLIYVTDYSMIEHQINKFLKEIEELKIRYNFSVVPISNSATEEDIQKNVLDFGCKRFQNSVIFQDLNAPLFRCSLPTIEDRVIVDYTVGTNFSYSNTNGHKLVVFKKPEDYFDNKYDALVIDTDYNSNEELRNVINNNLMTIFTNPLGFNRLN